MKLNLANAPKNMDTPIVQSHKPFPALLPIANTYFVDANGDGTCTKVG